MLNPGSTTALDAYNTTLDAAGNFSVFTTRTETYDVAINASHWLRKVVSNVTFGATGASSVSATLVNGDKVVSLGDLSPLRAAFGSIRAATTGIRMQISTATVRLG